MKTYEQFAGIPTPELPESSDEMINFGGEKSDIPAQVDMALFEMGSRLKGLEEKLQGALQTVTNPEKKEKIFAKLKEIRAQLTPHEVLQKLKHNTSEDLSYKEATDTLDAGYKKETSGILDGIQNIFSSLEKYITDPKLLFLTPLVFVFESVREHPILTAILLFTLLASVMGVGPTITAILAGAGSIWEQIKVFAKYFDIDIDSFIDTVLTYLGLGAAGGAAGGYAAVKGGKFAAKKVGQLAKKAGKSALKKGLETGGKAIGIQAGKSSGLGIAARLAQFAKGANAFLLALTPTTMGDGELLPREMNSER